MADTAKRQAASKPGESAAPKKTSRARRAAPSPDVTAVVHMSGQLQRLCTRGTRSLWRERGLSERALFILELVNAGLDRPSRLIEFFDVLPSTITFETDKLVAAGLIVREPAPADRRVVRLALTVAGRRLHGEVSATLTELLQPRLARVSPEVLRSFLDTFAILLAPDAEAETPTETPVRP